MKNKLLNFLTSVGLAFTIFSCNGCVTKYPTTLKIDPDGTVHHIIQNRENLESLVLTESKKYNIVMFGDIHDAYGHDNEFVKGLLKRYKAIGFNYFAIEVGTDPKEGTNTKIYRDYVKGEITKEEISESFFEREYRHTQGWFNIIETAKKLGMEIICYDANPWEYSDIEERDQLALKNLQELILDKDPNAKVVIYAGAFHTSETPVFDEESGRVIEVLGCNLDKLTNGKSLTIDICAPYTNTQTKCDISIELQRGRFFKHN